MGVRVVLDFTDAEDAHDCADWLDTIDDGAARDLAFAIRRQVRKPEPEPEPEPDEEPPAFTPPMPTPGFKWRVTFVDPSRGRDGGVIYQPVRVHECAAWMLADSATHPDANYCRACGRVWRFNSGPKPRT